MKKSVLPEKKVELAEKKVETGKRVRLPAKGKIAPRFDSLLGGPSAEPVPNPLDGATYDDTLQGDADAEVSAALAAILEERKKRRDAFRLMADTEYWLCLCFQSKEQKLEFLAQAGWKGVDDKYFDGLACANTIGIEIEPIELPARKGTTKTPRLLRRQEVIVGEKADSS